MNEVEIRSYIRDLVKNKLVTYYIVGIILILS